ncbi:MAG: serine dehydratase subunit alpha family protein [Anaerolineales bacterium]|nr:serine dehydratase subunit alpha family protein [Anaerolineales bacterium]MCK5314844.1 serine dehydratase subunit alpha family protein [Anaerolineales bacterium]
MSFTVKDILRMEVAPALGCTEPSAIALGAAAAAALLDDEEITSIEVWVDANIYKNSVAVSIPGTAGLCGLDVASALGAIGGDPELKLEVLEPVDDDVIAKAQKILRAGGVKINLLPDQKGLFIKTAILGERTVAESVIMDSHDNITSLTINSQEISDSPLLSKRSNGGSKGELFDLEAWLRELSLPELLGLVDDLDTEDIRFLEEGVQYNLRLADYGLKHGSGLGVGKTLDRLVRQQLIEKDMILAAKILTSAASDARMSGVKMPAMSSAGSGNHGLTAILPIWAVKDYLECDKRDVFEAIALSHIITAFIKAYTGRLSALCGCSIAAGAGATAGITYLLGGTIHHIAGAIKNLTEDLAGVICDGAKAGCSLKLATAAGTAVQAALFALQGVQVHSTNGIIAASPEQTMQNIGTLSTQGMIETDRTILQIMMEKEFSGI